MPQMPADYLGLLALTAKIDTLSRLPGPRATVALNADLRSAYAATDKPVVFVDESFRLEGTDRFYIAATLHRDFEASTFVIDARRLAAENQADQRTIRDLRRSGQVGRDVTAIHVRPSEEPLIALADILAWSFRQEHARNDPSWFEPLREHTQVTRLA